MNGRVLIVDDSTTIRTYLKQLLSKQGFEVEASNSIWISNLVTEFKPNLILMDLNYGSVQTGEVRSGEMAIQTLKRNKIGTNIAVVIYSSEDEATMKAIAHKTGADGYISKDVDEQTLRRSVARYMMRHAS
jgi:CheY-like chemotaxis protein